MPTNSTRRDFLKTSTAVGAAVYVSGRSVLAEEEQKAKSPMERVQYACIGVGGKGRSDSTDAGKHGDVIAICDVDEDTLNKAAKNPAFKEPETFVDFRELIDKLGDKLDAVTVSTPDHTHAPAAAMAMKQGLACFCQKPLTHSVYEARTLSELAKEHNVATQMGNQGTARSGLRKAAAILAAGHLGEIQEAHIFTNRPVWEQGIPRPEPEQPPENLHWDLWIGPAPMRPYGKGYHPFSWRGWWDFGTGALGDMACHTFNMPFMALRLQNPTSIIAECSGHNKDSYPQSSKIKFQFPEEDGRAAIPVWWYDGGNLPPNELIGGKEFKKTGKSPSGSVIVGDKLVMYSWGDYGEDFVLLDPESFEEVETPDVEFEESPGHFTEFHQAVTGERKEARSNFPNYAGPLTETILLGNLAVWMAADGQGTEVYWDAENLEATNAPEVGEVIKREYREGYTL